MKKIIAAIVYTHLWIAICAAAMVLQTSYLLSDAWIIGPLVYLTFGGTLFTYAIHRLVGLQKLKDIKAALNPRYIIIDRDQQIVLGFGILGGLIAAYSFFQLQRTTQYWLILPAVISMAYVLPFLSDKRRLRDIGILKIFLIAIAYVLITVHLVHIEMDLPFNKTSWILLLEKGLFIFAITIPFDIRDLSIDKKSRVETIPRLLGAQSAICLALTCLLGCMALVYINDLYIGVTSLAMIAAYIVTLIYIQMTKVNRPDLFYSFGMDGLMVIQTVFLLLFNLI